MRFTNERREELKKLYPELSVLDITRKLGEEWMTLAKDIKQPYLDAADIDKARYNAEVKDYQAKLVSRIEKKVRLNRTKIDFNFSAKLVPYRPQWSC